MCRPALILGFANVQKCSLSGGSEEFSGVELRIASDDVGSRRLVEFERGADYAQHAAWFGFDSATARREGAPSGRPPFDTI
jgi:hypothetical protein